MKCGETFLLYDDDSESQQHLHIAITDAEDNNDSVLLVSVTSLRARSDMMTQLAPGDHPFIRHASVITYAYSKLLQCSHIENLIATGEARRLADASESIVQRAQDGMRETDRAPREVKSFFINWLGQRKNPLI